MSYLGVPALIHCDVSVCWTASTRMNANLLLTQQSLHHCDSFTDPHSQLLTHSQTHTISAGSISPSAAHEIIITPRNAPATHGWCEMFWLTRDTEREVLPNPLPAVPVAKSKTLPFVYAVEVQSVFHTCEHTLLELILKIYDTHMHTHTLLHFLYIHRKCFHIHVKMLMSHRYHSHIHPNSPSHKMLLHLHKTFTYTQNDLHKRFMFSLNVLKFTQSALSFTHDTLAFTYPFAQDTLPDTNFHMFMIYIIYTHMISFLKHRKALAFTQNACT